jgi:hypothetical protein
LIGFSSSQIAGHTSPVTVQPNGVRIPFGAFLDSVFYNSTKIQQLQQDWDSESSESCAGNNDRFSSYDETNQEIEKIKEGNFDKKRKRISSSHSARHHENSTVIAT